MTYGDAIELTAKTILDFLGSPIMVLVYLLVLAAVLAFVTYLAANYDELLAAFVAAMFTIVLLFLVVSMVVFLLNYGGDWLSWEPR